MLFSALLMSTACGAAPDTPPSSAEALAAAWSGGRTDPVCRSRGPRGEYLGPIPGAEYCQWPTVARGSEFGTVSATRDSLNGWGLVTWERVVTDTLAVRRVLDSLDAVFSAAPFVSYACPEGARRWQAPGLVVQSAPAAARATGGQVLLIFAVASTESVPVLLCPDAPRFQPRADRAPGARTG